MAIIIILIAISLSIALLFLAIFYWNMRSGQYDDTYTPSVRILFDNKPKTEKENDPRKYSSTSADDKESSVARSGLQPHIASDGIIESDR